MTCTLREARRRAGKTQAETAALLGISTSSYRRIERRPQTATVEQARQLCQIIGVDVDEVNFFASELYKK